MNAMNDVNNLQETKFSRGVNIKLFVKFFDRCAVLKVCISSNAQHRSKYSLLACTARSMPHPIL